MRRLLLVLALVGCDDATSGRGSAGDGSPGDGGVGADVGRPDGGEADEGVVEPPDAAGWPEPGFVEMALSPRRALYTTADHPQASAVVYDKFGDEIPGFPLRWDVQPAGKASIDEAHALTFLAEGPGAVRACATPDLCGRVSFFVDEGLPALEITEPARGAVVTGDPVVTVRGRTDPDPEVRVFLNDAPVEVAEDGSFSKDVPVRFGLNRVDVIADDGVRRPPARVVREVVWAPAVHPHTPEGVAVDDAIAVRVAQRLLDSGEAAPEPVDGVQVLGDVAGMVEAFLARAEPLGLLVDDPVLSEGEPLALRVEGLDIGTPDVELTFVDDGIEAFVRIEGLTVTVEGELVIEGERFDLGGTVHVNAAAYVTLLLETVDGVPRLRVAALDIAIERLWGALQDSTAQAVLDTIGSLLRSVLDGFARDLVQDLVGNEIPEFIELGLRDALGGLLSIPIDVVEDSPPLELHLGLGFELRAPTARARDGMVLGLGGGITQPAPLAEGPHPTDGVPAEGVGEPPTWPAGAPLAVAIRLVVINGLLHEAWRQGALRIPLDDAIPDNFRALIASARVDAVLPPLVVPTAPGSPYLFELQLGELELSLRGGASEVEDVYSLSIRAGVSLVIEDGVVRFEVTDQPDVRGYLVEQRSERLVLDADGLATLVGPLVWSNVQEQLSRQLHVELPAIHVGADAFGDLAPTIADIQLVPTFPAEPVVRHGWVVLPAALEARITDAQ